MIVLPWSYPYRAIAVLENITISFFLEIVGNIELPMLSLRLLMLGKETGQVYNANFQLLV